MIDGLEFAPPLMEFNNDQKYNEIVFENEIVLPETIKYFESLNERLLIEKIDLGILYFEANKDIETADYFKNKVQNIRDLYKELIGRDSQNERDLRDYLYQEAIKRSGILKAKETMDNFTLTLSAKRAIYINYLSALERLLEEIELQKELNIKIKINNLFSTETEDVKISSGILKIKREFFENLSMYNEIEQNKYFNYLYSAIYKVIIDEIRKGYAGIYNHLHDQDRVYLVSHFIDKVKNSILKPEEKEYFLRRISNSIDWNSDDRYNEFISILREFLNKVNAHKTTGVVAHPTASESMLSIITREYMKNSYEGSDVSDANLTYPKKDNSYDNKPRNYHVDEVEFARQQKILKQLKREKKTGIFRW